MDFIAPRILKEDIETIWQMQVRTSIIRGCRRCSTRIVDELARPFVGRRRSSLYVDRLGRGQIQLGTTQSFDWLHLQRK
jgi:hypothetical protein